MAWAAFRLVAAASLVPATAIAIAQAPPPPPVLRSGIELVTVDITVLNRGGEPLAGLAASDFAVTVDGTPRRIVALSLVRTGERAAAGKPQPDAAPPAPPPADRAPARRLFVVAIDRDHIAAGEGQQALEAGARFIDALPPGDRVAIWTIPPARTGLRFSDDRETVKRELRLAVGTYRPSMLGGITGRGQFTIGRDEALQIVDQGRRDILTLVVRRECPNEDPERPYQSSCASDVEGSARAVADDWRERARVTLLSLDNLVRSLGTMEGVKHLVLLTGGPLNTRKELDLVTGISARAAAARVTIHALQVADAAYLGPRATQVGDASGQIDQSLSAAYFLAGDTGGLAITTASGEIGFKRLTRELSAGYELAFETTPADRDGKLHTIDVRVSDRGWGSVVRARKTFRIDPAAAAARPPRGAASAAARERPAANRPTPERPDPVGPEVAGLTGPLADYVDRFERELPAVVAEERYVQVIHPWRGDPTTPDAEPLLAWADEAGATKAGPPVARRQILSDVLMVQARSRRWAAYRDVSAVDGRAIRDRTDRVRDLFLSNEPASVTALRTIADESARHNLGNLRRDLNVPTIILSFMRRADQWRYQFTRGEDETIDGRAFHVLRFVERGRPTLIGNADGFDIPIEGRIWLDAEDSRVARTEVRFEGYAGRVLIRAEFRPDASAGVLVPARMWEWYEGVNQLGEAAGDKTLVQCLATYSNLRRLQPATTGEIK